MIFKMNYTIDSVSNNEYFIVYCNDVEFIRVSKKRNTLEQLKAYLGI